MKIDLTEKSKLGDFKLIPEEGKELRTFIDYESKLLIVSETPIDISSIPSNYGIKAIPSTQYIVDTNCKKILNPSEWKKYFNYNEITNISPDGKLKEVVQRVHEPENNTDSLKYNLINLEQDETIYANGSSVAFDEEPRESSISRYYKHLENTRRYLRTLELKEYPEEVYNNYLKSLDEGDLVIQYFNENKVFELKYERGKFVLKKSRKPTNRKGWENTESKTFWTFDKLDEFWRHLTSNSISRESTFSNQNPWYTEYKLRIKNFAIEKIIIEEHNKIVKNRIVPYQEYQELHHWMNVNYNRDLARNVFWQFCSNCRERVMYNPRYPNHACRKCVKLIKDNLGNELNYEEKHELKYMNGEEKMIIKDTEEPVRIFINNIEYSASEARFGGIVHQIRE